MKISTKQYAKLIASVMEGLKDQEIPRITEKIARLIRVNKDQGKIADIISEFSRLVDQQNGIVHATIISVRPLDAQKRSVVCRFIAQRTQTSEENVILQEKIDPTIKGGLIVRIGNEIWDASVQRKIELLATQLTH